MKDLPTIVLKDDDSSGELPPSMDRVRGYDAMMGNYKRFLIAAIVVGSGLTVASVAHIAVIEHRAAESEKRFEKIEKHLEQNDGRLDRLESLTKGMNP